MAADLAPTPLSGITVQALRRRAPRRTSACSPRPSATSCSTSTTSTRRCTGPGSGTSSASSASLVVAGRGRAAFDGTTRPARRPSRPSRTYRERMAEYAGDARHRRLLRAGRRRRRSWPSSTSGPGRTSQSTVQAAAHHDALHELPKLTDGRRDGRRRIVDHPPDHHAPAEIDARASSRRRWPATATRLQEDRRVLLDRYQLVDAALKVVGRRQRRARRRSSRSSRAATDDDPLFLQAKEAEASVLERFLAPEPLSRPTASASSPASAGSRPRATCCSAGRSGRTGRHLYVRQLQDQKGGAVVEAMTLDDLVTWGGCAAGRWPAATPAPGEPAEIAGYLGDDDAVRPRHRRLRRALRRPERAGPRGLRRRDRGRPDRGRVGGLTRA